MDHPGARRRRADDDRDAHGEHGALGGASPGPRLSRPPLGGWRLHAALAALTGGYALVGVLGWRDLHVPLAHWVAHGIALGGLVAAAWVARRWLPPLADGIVAVVWALWCNATTAPFSYAVVRARVPLRDDLLVAFDRALGLPVPGVRDALHRLLAPETWWTVYDALAPLFALTLLLLPLAGRVGRARRTLVASALSFGLALPLMTALQAVGPWAAHGYPPSPEQLGYVRELTALKATGPFAFDPLRITGVVTFPSFHTVLAALCGWGIAPVRWVGPPGAVLSAGIVLATVATGWHYVADVAAGLAVAGVAIHVSGRLERWWES